MSLEFEHHHHAMRALMICLSIRSKLRKLCTVEEVIIASKVQVVDKIDHEKLYESEYNYKLEASRV